ncbi:RTA1-domain-containing protein [Lepidopterella palustris CBS 459.81]|uniref:RTA1-domain-containing protein n=1 Tax=Lepidopterella palustris CBS 459.81 TaxID=1314670 RepID=A0A8E2JFA4_9PEZI|nr:RTA1-domain-containing protein [Lepidopterella palustris CBS 459.81]
MVSNTITSSVIASTTAHTTTSATSPSCTTATPGKYGHVPIGACNAYYAFNPSFAVAFAFMVLFGTVTVVQIVQAIRFKKSFCWVIIMGCLWELTSFVARTFGAHNQQSIVLALISQLFLLLAPLWINAYVYMTAGRLIWTFLPAKRIWKVKAMSIGKYFVWLDIVSFLIQGMGGLMLSPGASAHSQSIGKNVYMTGVGVQELFICLFTALIIRFHYEMLQLEKSTSILRNPKWKWLAYTLYMTLALITTRIIYRLAEFSGGIGTSNPLPYHEVYALALDAIPMLVAIIILSVMHPGMVLVGPESEFPSRKEKEAMKKAKKEAKTASEERKMKSNVLGQDTGCYPVYNPSTVHLVDDVELQAHHGNRSSRSGGLSRDHSTGPAWPM